MPEKCTYKVTSPIKHDGERYPIGGFIELTDKEAAPLRASGSISVSVVEVIIQQPKGEGDTETDQTTAPGTSEERPDNAAPGEQIDGQGLPPAADAKNAQGSKKNSQGKKGNK